MTPEPDVPPNFNQLSGEISRSIMNRFHLSMINCKIVSCDHPNNRRQSTWSKSIENRTLIASRDRTFNYLTDIMTSLSIKSIMYIM